MQEKQYLFYEKQSLAAFWKTSMLAEKIFLVCWSINAVLMAIIFAVLTPMATDRGTAIFIFTLVWVLIFPGVLWIFGGRDEKRDQFLPGILQQKRNI